MWTALKALAGSVKTRGVGRTLTRALAFLADKHFDFVNGTDTYSSVDVQDCAGDSEVKSHAVFYEPMRVLPLRALFDSLGQGYLSSESVLVDFGCGKGRVLMVASEYGVKVARGVEFAAELCAVARANCEAFRLRRRLVTRFDVVHCDAARYSIKSEEDVFFFYHPFDTTVFARVMDNIADSLRSSERRVAIIYFNLGQADKAIIERCGFRKLTDWTRWSYRFAVYANQPRVQL